MKLELADFTKEVLAMTRDWLADADVRFLTNSYEISIESQLEWFSFLKQRQDYLIKTVEVDGVAIGVIGLKNLDRVIGKGEYFGYIGNKAYWGRGIGNWMMDKAMELGKEQSLSKIYLNVIVENLIAINLYFKKGFKIVEYTGTGYLMESNLK